MRGTEKNPIITVTSRRWKGKTLFKGTRKEHQIWFDSHDFKQGTIHHVFTDYGHNKVGYFRAIKQ